jgi:hypothetical protein
MLARVRIPSSPVRERKREKEGGRERERERCRIWLFSCVKEMTGALAPFNYLVRNNNSVDNNEYLKRCFNKPVLIA